MKSDLQTELHSNSQFLTAEVVGVRSSSSLSYGAVVVVVVAPAAVLLYFGRYLALLALLLLHEQVYQQNLLFVDLQTNVFRDVWD